VHRILAQKEVIEEVGFAEARLGKEGAAQCRLRRLRQVLVNAVF
jgi:hypothetical protein